MFVWGRGVRHFGAALVAILFPVWAWAAAVDLQVSSYTWSPDPVVYSGTSTFTVTVQNNDYTNSSTGSQLVVDPLPSNLTFSTAPSGCTLGTNGGGAQTLTCILGALAPQASASISFDGVGNAPGAQSTTVTLTDTTAGNTDANTANNQLVKTVTSIKGADLSVSNSGPANADAGSYIDFTLVATNNGPDPASSFQVTDTLPAAVDFSNITASGSGWSCTVSTGVNVVCNYTGAALANGQSTSPITVHGQLVTTAGTISNGVSIASTDGLTGDPNWNNNTASNVVVTVNPATALRANQQMTGSVIGEHTRFISGATVTLALSATNLGPQAAQGVTLSDTIPANFTIASVPTGCSASGQVVTCSVGNLANGATSSPFNVTLTAPTVGASTSNSNTVSVARTSPTLGTNTPSTVNYTVVPAYTHLLISKVKTPSPVLAGGTMTSSIRVRNDPTSPGSATGTVTVVDTLNDYPNEKYISVAGTAWSCTDTTATDKKVTCSYTLGSTLTPGSYVPDNLVITTQADAAFTGGTLTNTACDGQTQSPGDIYTTSCASKSAVGTQNKADLAITKSYSLATVGTADTAVTSTLTVSNNGPNTAATVYVHEPIPMYYARGTNHTGLSYTVTPALGSGESCSYSGSGAGTVLDCTLKNLANAGSRSIALTITRPAVSGTYTGVTATVSSPDTVETNSTNNSAAASVTIVPIADVAVTSVAAALDPDKAGVNELFTVSLKNNGPNPAAGVQVQIPVDTTKVTLDTSSISLTGTGGSCSAGVTFSGGSYSGQTGILCSGFTMSDNESRQVSFKVMPTYAAYPSAGSYTTNAAISTTTFDSNAGNATGTKAVSVTTPQLDLSVTKQEETGYQPQGPGGPTTIYDPIAFGDDVIYRVTLRNNGPSLATQVKLVDTPAAPSGYTYDYVANSVTVNTSQSNYTPTHTPTCSWATGTLTCYLGTGAADSQLPANSYVALDVTFRPAGANPPSSLTFSNSATISSAETVSSYDTQMANNSVTENTTVLPKTDLTLADQAVARNTTTNLGTPVSLNEPFDYLITVKNLGPSDASGVKVTHTLPAGFVLDGTAANVTVSAGTNVSLSLHSCSGTGTVTCNLGTIPGDATGTDTTKQVTIRIPVKAAYRSSGSYPFGFNSNLADSATIAVLPSTSLDPNAANNSASVNVQVQKSSIAGTIYSDNDRSGSFTSGEGINGATVKLSGTDSWGNTIAVATATTVTTNASGAFTVDKLPPGSYKLVETQPANTYDGLETAGSGGGDVPAATCDGINNCVNTPAANTIGANTPIALPAATALTGYQFQEYSRATVTGYVYHDANNDGLRASSGEAGVAGVTLTLSGTAYNGQNLCTLISCSVTTAANGSYNVALPPSKAGTSYTVTEQAQNSAPLNGTYLDGLDQYQSGSVITGSAGKSGTSQDSIIIGKVSGSYPTGIGNVDPGVSYGNRNFGELKPASLGGYVFIDANNNGIRDAGETTGVFGVSVTLTGTDDLGNAVNRPVTTGANGAYSIGTLRPGSYTVTETPPAGLTATGVQVGSNGGTVAAAAVSGITVHSADTATGYNFGESGQGLAGAVYVDLNGNGQRDSGEPGIAGVQVTLSGTAQGGSNVCAVISPNPCTVTTAADGSYSFTGLPLSATGGYTLSEQSQSTPPLGDYADATDACGTLGGTLGSNQCSGIALSTGGAFGTGYNFAHRGSVLSGSVTVSGSGTPVAGVTITLSGTTGGGQNVCSVIPNCATTTASDGSYHFAGLPGGNFTLIESQPPAYGNGTATAGSVGGNTTVLNRISSIALPNVTTGSGYNFQEGTGTLSGSVYDDHNVNGSQDSGEAGIANVTLTLSGTDLLGNTVNKSVTTDANGHYSFTGLLTANASGYTITETPPSGWLDGTISKGQVGGSACSSCNTATANKNQAIPFQPDSSFTGFDFGHLHSTSVTGLVYHDVNKNGTRETGEVGLGSITLTLSGTDDKGSPVNKTTQTAADGSFSFTNLRPSDATGYTLTETQPSGINDFSGASGTHVGSAGGIAALNRISGIVLGSGTVSSGNQFREDASIFTSGLVYLDANDDGIHQSSEAGLAGVTVTLTASGGGACADGSTSCTVTSAADGSFVFGGLRQGTYTLTETQPVIYTDGRETAGTAGGTVDNSAFGSSAALNRISAIALAAGTAASGYSFGDLPGVRASVSGKVWLNTASGGSMSTFDPGDSPMAGWIVELVHNGSVLATTTSGADGSYAIHTVTPDYNYSVRFRNPANNMIWAGPVANGGTGTANKGSIDGITVPSGGNITGLDLPIDPSGVIYDSVTRKALAGAQITISGPAGFSPATDVVGGTATQTTGSDGLYQFFLNASAPAGTYTLSVSPPAGYVPGQSALIPPAAGPLVVGPTPDPHPIQAQATPPTGSDPTTYYLAFGLTATSGNVINNHIPADPILGGAVAVTKTTPKVTVTRGGLVPYTITLRNTLAAGLSNIALTDQMPAGFKYVKDSAYLDGVRTAPTVNGRSLVWNHLSLAAKGTHTIKLILVVGSGVGESTYVNQAWVDNTVAAARVSNVAQASVRVVADPIFDCSDVVGKVFDDRNRNGYQDPGEPGLPGVRLATVRGWLITTDAKGRYHVACAAVPDAMHGSNFILKLDERTLPSGYRVTTENPRVVRLTQGKMVKLNFGAAIHRVVRLDLDQRAFDARGRLDAAYRDRLNEVIGPLHKAPSILRLAYHLQPKEKEGEAHQRLDQVKALIRRHWSPGGCCYDLLIEEEVVQPSDDQEVEK